MYVWFWLSADKLLKWILYINSFFLAKWLSLSFDQTIFRKKGWVGGLVALQIFCYLKRQLELLIFNERFYW